jgi:hypothetical protein
VEQFPGLELSGRASQIAIEHCRRFTPVTGSSLREHAVVRWRVSGAVQRGLAFEESDVWNWNTWTTKESLTKVENACLRPVNGQSPATHRTDPTISNGVNLAAHISFDTAIWSSKIIFPQMSLFPGLVACNEVHEPRLDQFTVSIDRKMALVP